MKRRTVLAAGAWVPPAILLAELPAGGATLSGTPVETRAVESSNSPPGKPLAFTGFDTVQTSEVGIAAVTAGTVLWLWARDGSKTWPVR